MIKSETFFHTTIYLILEYYARLIRNHLCRNLFINRKPEDVQLSLNHAPIFSCEFRESFKNTFLAEHLLAATFKLYKC